MNNAKSKKQWLGETTCVVCGLAEPRQLVDGRTRNGYWAIMCTECHREHGRGLGLGKGQLYERNAFEEMLKGRPVYEKVEG